MPDWDRVGPAPAWLQAAAGVVLADLLGEEASTVEIGWADPPPGEALGLRITAPPGPSVTPLARSGIGRGPVYENGGGFRGERITMAAMVDVEVACAGLGCRLSSKMMSGGGGGPGRRCAAWRASSGWGRSMFRRYLARTGGVRAVPQARSARQLSLQEREEISRGLAAGRSCRLIAAGLGRHPSTVSREVARNGGREAYRACDSDAAALVRARRPKQSKLEQLRRLRDEVVRGLELEWSPEQISHRLRLDFPDDARMWVSHETIYLTLFVPSRRSLPGRLTQRLRSGRAMSFPKVARAPSARGRLRGMVAIHERPAEADDRLVPGHWEGDLVMGRRPSAVATLVERSSRYVQLVALPDGIKADAVSTALTAALSRVPAPLLRSLAWDRGREMAAPAQLTAATGYQGLLLRSQKPLAARHQREHQPAPAPIPQPHTRPPSPRPASA